MKMALVPNKTVSVILRDMAIPGKENIPNKIKITSPIHCVQADITVVEVVCLILPIAPRVGQPQSIAGNAKNNTGIIKRKMGTATIYLSPAARCTIQGAKK